MTCSLSDARGSEMSWEQPLGRTQGMARKKTWMLINHADGYTQASNDAKASDVSAVRGWSLAEIAVQAASSPPETFRKSLRRFLSIF